MLNIKTLSILAIAGSAAAAPQWGSWAGKYFSGSRGDGDDAAATALEIVTAYTTVTYQGGWNGNYGGHRGGKQSDAASTVVASTAAASSVAAFTPPAAPAAPSPTPVASSPAAVTPVASSSAPAASTSAPVASSGSSQTGYMGIVNEWRAKLGLSDLTESDTLQGNALKTCQDGNGQMVHELNPGSFAQVLAPGSADEFEKVFVGGWLCERPDLPGLNGICTTMSQGWAYDGQTGHADILVSTSYSKIGCALANGIWGCDLA